MGVPYKDVHKKNEGFRYNGAVVQFINWENKQVDNEIKYLSPVENIGMGLSMMFKGAYRSGEDLWIVTNTEVLQYEMTNNKLVSVFSDPSFNDLHGVYVNNEEIYICNTGLEIVQCMNTKGEITNQWNIAEYPTWDRFDKEVDYRKIATTKPHEVHINHIFNLDGEMWVNLGSQRKAQSLDNKDRIIDLDSMFGVDEKVLCHDGLVKGDFIYFTSVNGSLVIVSKQTLKVEERIDLNKSANLNKVIGWTRGCEVIGTKAYIGVSKMRHSKFKDYTKWIVKGDKVSLPSSILEVDLLTKDIVDIYEIENHSGAGVYSIIAVN